jgi:hypothetical protein
LNAGKQFIKPGKATYLEQVRDEALRARRDGLLVRRTRASCAYQSSRTGLKSQATYVGVAGGTSDKDASNTDSVIQVGP